MRIVVLGLGNVLLSDEGVGVRIIEALEDLYYVPEEVDVVDGGTSGMELMDVIAGCDCLIVADAIRSDSAPGTLIRLEDNQLHAFFQTRMSPHQLGLCDLLAALRLTDETPGKVILMGIVPGNLELGLALTPAVAVARNEAVRLICAELLRLGLDCAPRLQEVGMMTAAPAGAQGTA